jgi:hypothetical protein
MTTHAYKRCHHCQVVYSYQGSGHGCQEQLNDHKHCPDCKQVIIDALALVPKRFEKVLIPVTDQNAVELEALSEEQYQAKLTKARERVNRHGLITDPLPDGALPIYDKDVDVTAAVIGLPIFGRRVYPGLYDLKDPSNKDHRGATTVDGRLYHWNYWSKDPEGTSEVRVEMERDLKTGEEIPWRDYR